MGNWKLLWVIWTTFLGISAPMVDGLQCYECGEESNLGSCQDFSPADKFSLECPSQYQSCVSTLGSFGDFEVKTRKCGVGKATNSCSSMEIGDAMATVCSCDSSLCNQSSVMSPDSAFILLTSLTMVIRASHSKL